MQYIWVSSGNDDEVLNCIWLEISSALMEIIIDASLIAYFIPDWLYWPGLHAGVALSTTSMAVVYAVMIEYG